MKGITINEMTKKSKVIESDNQKTKQTKSPYGLTNK